MSSRIVLISLYLGVNSIRLPLLLVVNCLLQHLQVYSFTCEVTDFETLYWRPKTLQYNLFEAVLVKFFFMVDWVKSL